MLIGTAGVYSYTFEHEKKPDCPVCGGESLELSISSEMTVELLIEMLTERQNMYVCFPFQLSYTTLSFVDSAVKLKSRRYPPRRARSTSRHHHSWKRPRGQTWRRKSQTWFRMGERSPSQPPPCRSAYLFAFHIISPSPLLSPDPHIHIPVSKVAS